MELRCEANTDYSPTICVKPHTSSQSHNSIISKHTDVIHIILSSVGLTVSGDVTTSDVHCILTSVNPFRNNRRETLLRTTELA